MKTRLKYKVQSFLWFSGIFTLCGILLYGVAFFYTLWGGVPPYGDSLIALAGCIIIFNTWGFAFIAIIRRVAGSSQRMALRSRSRFLFFYFCAGTAILALTYVLVIAVKAVSGDADPLHLSMSGFALLATLWIIEMLLLSMFLIELSARRTVDLYHKKRRLEQDAMKMQYQALQNQLNPHFLFNNLSVLVAEIESDPENAVRFVQNLSDIYRYVLQQSSKETATLKEELDFFGSYLFLYKTRYGDKLIIRENIPVSAHNAELPPLTLQLLMENALKHNSMTVNSPLCITMDVSADGSMLRFSNNIQHTLSPYESSGKGLVNLSARYSILFGTVPQVVSDDKEFSVSIPLIYVYGTGYNSR